MSLEQDLLFCKIAISSGKVAQEDAQKCLALANRFEAEGRRRPLVGAIFIKNNLLTNEDVQRIYGAVQKRLEVQGASGRPAAVKRGHAPAHRVGEDLPPRIPAARARPPAARTARPVQAAPPPRAASGAVHVSHRPTKEKIEPLTLWMGIGFGLVVLACFVAMIFMLLKKPPPPPEVSGGIPGRPESAAASSGQPPVYAPGPKADNKALLDKFLKGGTPEEKKTEEKKTAEAPTPPTEETPAAPPEGDAAATPPPEEKAEGEGAKAGEEPEKKGAGVE